MHCAILTLLLRGARVRMKGMLYLRIYFSRTLTLTKPDGEKCDDWLIVSIFGLKLQELFNLLFVTPSKLMEFILQVVR
jgi:hypothetical protein